MKIKYRLLFLVMLIVIVVVYIAVLTRSKSINTTIHGVHFQLGTEPISNVQPETISIQGSFSTKLNGLRTFNGLITFEHDTLPVPKDSRDLTIHFDKNGFGPIIYAYFEKSETIGAGPKTFSNGALFANSDFSLITYLPRDAWNGENGLMYAGPATTRKQALIISNELMKNFLKRADNDDSPYVLD